MEKIETDEKEAAAAGLHDFFVLPHPFLSDLKPDVPDFLSILDVVPGKRIHVGGEATLLEGSHEGRVVVIRQLHPPLHGDWRSPDGSKVIENAEREASILSSLHHQNIISFVGLYRPPDEGPAIVLARAKFPAVLQYLRNNSCDLMAVIYGLVKGVDYLHSRAPPIAHGDLHPGNLVINEHGVLQIIDFGRSRTVSPGTSSAVGAPGRLRFLPPELNVTSRPFYVTLAADIYSTGLTLYALAIQDLPFKGLNEWKAAEAARDGSRPARPANLGNLEGPPGNALWNVITDMWLQNPASRPTASVMQSRFSQFLLEHGDPAVS